METQITGQLAPVLTVALGQGESVIAESGELSWYGGDVKLETGRSIGMTQGGLFGAAKRAIGGGTFWMTRYQSVSQPGTVAFPARLPGKIVQVPLGDDRSYLIQRRGFLAGLEGCELSTAFQPSKVGTGLFGGGFGAILQKLEGAGHAWVELSGELSEYDLALGQSLRVHPAHVGLVEGSVNYELTTVPGIKNKLFGGDGLFLIRLTGPGKVWLQSLSLPLLAEALEPYLPQPQQQNGGISLKLS